MRTDVCHLLASELMINSFFQTAFLRQISNAGATQPLVPPYPLSTPAEVLLGRDPRCHILLDSHQFGGVSRQHAKVCPTRGTPPGWQICDLNSSNGTYVNGERIYGCQVLKPGDRILLGHNGPEFIFELLPASDAAAASPAAMPSAPHPAWSPVSATDPARAANRSDSSSDSVTFSQLFPIVSTGRDLTRKAYLVPGILTVFFVVLMFVSAGDAVIFNLLLAAYIAGAAYYFVYQLCGKHKPWWLLASAGILTALILVSPILNLFIFVFREVLPGDVPTTLLLPEGASRLRVLSTFLTLLVQMFFGAGLMEELLKALPILAALYLGTRLRSPLREKVGVLEPLDGILLGTASAVGFTLLETLGQYVPDIVNDVTLQAGQEAGQLLALHILIPRILGSIAGHMAYSGYLGYFIGLSVLKPSKRWQILGVGYLTAALLHALWNASGILSLLLLALVGVLSYAFLAAAILKARALSPTRSQNFATRFTRFP